MNRNELLFLNNYKREELKKSLKPIINWEEVKKGTEIYHNDSVNIFSYDIFEGINNANDFVVCRNIDGKQYLTNKVGWFFYDREIADKIENRWTPKLWVVSGTGQYKEDYWFFIACNEEHLLKCWNEENRDNLTHEEFLEKYEINLLKEVDDFNIKVE